MNFQLKNSKGFTLLELLVAIAIVGIIGGIGIASFTTVQEKGRDTKRKADLNSIKIALEAYYSDFGIYPPNPSLNPDTVFTSDAGANWIPELTPTYIKTLPIDPKQKVQLPVFLALKNFFGAIFNQPEEVYAAGINFDAPSTSWSHDTSLTWSHTVSGTDRLLVVGVVPVGTSTVSSITYGGIPLTKIGRVNMANDVSAELWILVAPPLGTNNIVVNVSSATIISAGATSWTGVNQTTPTGAFFSNTGSSNTISVPVSSAVGEVVVDVAGARWDTTLTAPPDQTVRWTQFGNTDAGAGGSSKPGDTNVTMSWTISGATKWAIGAVSLKSSTAPTPTPTATPTPSPTPTPTPTPAPKFNYYYEVPLIRQTYVLWTQLENENDREIYSKSTATCRETPPANIAYNYCVQNP